MKLPSVKVILTLIAAITIVILIIIFSKNQNQPKLLNDKTRDAQKLSYIEKIASKAIEEDSDNDGLKNWEEALWKTDPNNPDTDDDGVSDGDEVALKSNPLIAGEEGGAGGGAETPDSLSETDKLARDFFSEYIKLKQANIPINQTIQQSLIESVVSRDFGQSGGAEPAGLGDIKTGGQANESSIKKYGNELGASLLKSTPPNLENELEILGKAVENDKKEDIGKLNPIIEGYDSLAKDLKNTLVPEGAESAHLAFLNAVLQIKTDIQNMAVVFDDPLKTFISIRRYGNDVSTLADSHQSLLAYFLKNKVTFQQWEDGYSFVNAL